MHTRKLLTVAAALLALALATGTALADTITVAGRGPGSATVVCEFNSQTNTFTFTITNTSTGGQATITAIGFDLPPAGNASASGLNGFSGGQAPSPAADFAFSDADLGRVPESERAVLDFGFVTGNRFARGAPAKGLAPGESASFTVSGAAFAGLTEAQICNAIVVRFERG